MENNCLVTKLNGVVDNDNLKKIGILELKQKSASSVLSFKIAIEKETVISISKGNFVNSSGTSIGNTMTIPVQADINTTTTVYLPANNEGAVISIPNKYYIRRLEFTSNAVDVNNSLDYVGTLDNRAFILNLLPITTGDFDISSIKQTISKILIRVGSGDISNLHVQNELDIRTSNVTGVPRFESTVTRITWNSSALLPTSTFNVADTFTNVKRFEANGIGLSGDISNLGSLIGCTEIVLSTGNTNINGSVEDLAAGLWDKGKRSGTVNLTKPTSVKLKNSGITNFLDFIFEASKVTVKEHNSGTVRATYDGSTWTYLF